MENKQFVLSELNTYIDALRQYQAAMEADDTDALVRLLDEGKRRKEEVDG